MLFLLLGDDRTAKDRKIDEIKKKYLPSSETLAFDYISLQAHKLDPAILKKALLDLPALVEKRVVVLTMIQKLNEQNKDIILEVLNEKHQHIVLILDSDQNDVKNVFIKTIKARAEAFSFSSGSKKTVWDMVNAIRDKKQNEALSVLFDLFEESQESALDVAVQIMGALVWAWGDMKKRRRLSSEHFKKGLLILQEADLDIKRSRREPTQAVELCVVKLSCLLI